MGIADKLEQLEHAVSLPVIAKLLDVSEITIRRLVKRGEIPFFRIGLQLRFDPKRMANWARQKEVAVR